MLLHAMANVGASAMAAAKHALARLPRPVTRYRCPKSTCQNALSPLYATARS